MTHHPDRDEGPRGGLPSAFSDPARPPRLLLLRNAGEGPFFDRRLAGSREMAAELGLSLDELCTHGDEKLLAERLRAEARAGAAAIIFENACGPEVRAAVEEALERGAKLVAVDSPVDCPGVPEVEPDDGLMGYLVARKLASDQAGAGSVAVVLCSAFAQQVRRDQAWGAVRVRHPRIFEVARADVAPAGAADEARRQVAGILEAHPETTAILALWDELARGAVKAVQEAGAAGRVAVYGVDITEDDLQLMVEPGSPWLATAAVDAMASGRLSVRVAAALLAGERLDRFLLQQPVLVTQAFLVGNRIRSMSHLAEALPPLGESHLAWFPWMDRLLSRNGQAPPAARLPPDQLPAQLRLTLAALEIRNEELQAAARTVHQARAELEQRVLERTAELSQANARLAASRAYLDRIIDSVAAPIFVKDRQHRFVLVNEAFCQMMARGREAVLGRTDDDFFPPEQARLFQEGDEQLFATGEEGTRDEKLTDARGALHDIVTRKALYRNDAGALFVVGVINDMTEHNRLEEQLRQSQKMETVGLLAGGVAHDFNNLLTPILGYAELLVDGCDPDDPDRELLEAIHAAAGRARDLTRRLLAFSRKQVLQPRPVDLVELVRRFCAMLRRTIRENVHIELDLPERLRPVRGDPGQLEQLLLNLAVNAQDAMPGGGAFRLRVREREEPPARAGASDAPLSPTEEPGRGSVVLTVSDTGCGMDEETAERAFEPFFTTKEVGRGTGLGLSTVYGIVRQHGGTIALRSRPGEGSTFEIALPVAEGEPAASAPPPGSLPLSAPRSGTVLVVEDEEMVRALTRRMLERFGYRVLEASSGEEALDIVRGHPADLDLLLTDVIMPRMNGRELHEAALSFRPRLPVLYMSGYPAEVTRLQGVLADGQAFLQKPFTAQALYEAVEAVLERRFTAT